MSLSQRSTAGELMDTECVDEADYQACLADLAKVNTLTLARRPTLDWLDRAMRNRGPHSPVSVFDVAYGEGDMLRAVGRWARRRGRAVRLGGVDLNPRSKDVALAAWCTQKPSPSGRGLGEGTPNELNALQQVPSPCPLPEGEGSSIGPISQSSRQREREKAGEPDLRTGDVLAHDPGPGWDYIISSLFTHHLDNTQVVAFLRWMEQHATRGWFVNDLHRHAIPHRVFRLGSRLIGWHRFVQHDGVVSIARAFTPAEWRALLAEAGVPGIVRWRFPFRLCVERLK